MLGEVGLWTFRGLSWPTMSDRFFLVHVMGPLCPLVLGTGRLHALGLGRGRLHAIGLGTGSLRAFIPAFSLVGTGRLQPPSRLLIGWDG